MNSEEIQRALRRVRDFDGVFAADAFRTNRTFSWSIPIPPADLVVIGCAYAWRTVAESISTRSGDHQLLILNVIWTYTARRGFLIADNCRV